MKKQKKIKEFKYIPCISSEGSDTNIPMGFLTEEVLQRLEKEYAFLQKGKVEEIVF